MNRLFHLFSRLEKSGVRLELVDDHLKINVSGGGELPPGLLQELKVKKEEIIDFLRRQTVDQKIAPQEKKEYYRLSPAQWRLYFSCQLAPESTSYNIPGLFESAGLLDRDRLDEAFKRLIERHESLRTSFTMLDEEPVQLVQERVTFELEVLGAGSEGDCCESLAPDQQLSIIQAFIRPFDLSRAPLLRVGLLKLAEDRHLLLVDMHHIISDGTSIGVLIREFAALYQGLSLPALKLQYRDYSEWLASQERQALLNKQEAYWLNEFKGEIQVLHLPLDYPRPARQDFSGNRVVSTLDEADLNEIKHLAAETHTTLYMVLLAAYFILLWRLSGQEDIVVGTPSAGRQQADLDGIIGMCVGTLPIRSFPSGQQHISAYIDEIKQKSLAALKNQDYPFEKLLEKVNVKKDISRNPLFDVMLVLQNLDFPGLEIDGAKLRPLAYQGETTKFDLTLMAEEVGGCLQFILEYGTKLFREKTIGRFAEYYRNILKGMATNPDQCLADIDIMSEAEKVQIMSEFSGVQAALPVKQTLVELFNEQVEKNPDRTALSGETVGANDNSPLHYSLSYSELDRLAADLAERLIDQGVLPNTIVALQLERSIEMIVGMLGILKAGGAYLPIDPEAPAERVQYMLADSGAEVILNSALSPVGDGALAPIPFTTGQNCAQFCLRLHELRAFRNSVQHARSGDCCCAPHATTDLAYVIYTSGSTGQPKGVAISHRNLCPLLHWGYEHLVLTPDDRTIQNLSYFFDWSAWEIFITLTSGASLHLINREILLNPPLMVEFMARHGITVLHCTPSQFQYLLNENLSFNSLRHLCLGAEKLDYDLLKRSLAAVRPDCRVYNMYGPTEATIMAAVLEIDKHEVGDYENLTSVPIGRFVGNTALWVLDRYLKLCPVGVAGELYIGGHGLARGYLNNPELTAEKFVEADIPIGSGLTQQSPSLPAKTVLSFACGFTNCGLSAIRFSMRSLCKFKAEDRIGTRPKGAFICFPGIAAAPRSPATTHHSPLTNRLYRTGDLCRWLDDGAIEFLGRIDFQVKIRGFRIELGEIEAQLLKHPDVIEAVVLARDGDNREKYLCAYLVAKAGQELETTVLREFLSQRLPGHMIPAHFIFLDRMPLNANGKVDRRALPEPGSDSNKTYLLPENSLEEALIDLWSSILEIEKDKIGTDRSFFELGGHSLKASVLVARIKKKFSVDVPLADIFKMPILKEMARLIANAQTSTGLEIEPVEEREYYELSYHQKRLWYIHQLDPDSTAFLLPGRILLTGRVDGAKVGRALEKLAQRHESFHTGFSVLAHEAVQFVLKEIQMDFSTIDLSTLTADEQRARREESFREISLKPFDLGRPPLFRAVWLRLSQEKSELQYNMHHIIADGWSLGVLRRDFLRLIETDDPDKGAGLDRLEVQYRDYAAWQNRVIRDGAHQQEAHRYWRERLNGSAWQLELPMDFTDREKDGQGAGFRCRLDEDLHTGLKALSSQCRTSLFGVMLSGYLWMLYRYSGRLDVGCSVISAGRENVLLHDVMGFFVNSLLFKIAVDEEESFLDFVSRVHREIMDSLHYQGYPVELVFKDMGVRYPEVGASFNMINLEAIGPSRAEPAPGPGHTPETQAVKFDIELYVYDDDHGLDLDWRYRKNAFKPATIEYIAGEYGRILDFFTAHPGNKLQDHWSGKTKRKSFGRMPIEVN